MARKKGLGFFGSLIGFSSKLGKTAYSEVKKSNKSKKRQAIKEERQERISLEREATRLKLLENYSMLDDVPHDTTLERLQLINQEWRVEFDQLRKFIERGKYFETTGELAAAIESYRKAIKFGENSNRLIFNNYAHSIKRVIILYGKTKDKTALKDYLQEIIDKYPSVSEREDWEKRLAKIKS